MQTPRRKFLALCMGLVLAWATVEGVVAAGDRDVSAVQNALYYQGVRLELHEADPNPRVRYGLRPNSQSNGASIGPSGLRNPTPADNAPGPHILFGGGSTVYGSQVADTETIPARLSHHLGGAAVWNLGVSAYVEAQILERCRTWLERLETVDLILVMNTNPGRRPFLSSARPDRATLRQQLWSDPGFVDENLPPPWGSAARGLHEWLVRLSPMWRYLSAVQAARLPHAHALRTVDRARADAAESLRIAAAARGVPVVYVHYPGHRLPCDGCWRGDLELSLERAEQPAQARDLHPPPAILNDHSAALAALLVEHNLVPEPSGHTPR